MPNKPDTIDATSAISARHAARKPEQEVPGTLTTWADPQKNKYYEFVGNGEISGTDLMHTVVNREAAEHNEALAPFDHAHDRAFAQFAATSLLGKGDASYSADQPIPKGQVEEISLKALLNLAAPFLQKYSEAVRAHDGLSPAPQGGSADEHRKLTGQMPSIGLTLPID
jgi:hypothetical protein